MSVLQVRCPGCQSTLRIPATAAGSKVHCSKCKQVLAIPAAQSAAPERAAPAKVVPPKPQAPSKPAPAVGDDFFSGTGGDAFGDLPAGSAATHSGSASPSAGSGFQTRYTQPASAAAGPQAAAKPKWLIPAIAAGTLMVAAMIGGVIFLFNATNQAVVESVEANRAAADRQQAQETAAGQQQLQETARANPLPENWQRQGAREVTVMMPPEAKVRELASPIQGTLLLRVDGTDPDSGAKFWLTEMPLPPATEIKRDQWLRNLYQYSGGQAEEVGDIVRGDVLGKRILLARDGELKDPLLEVFTLPDRMVIVSVQPAGPKVAEAFFASLELPKPGPVPAPPASPASDPPQSDAPLLAVDDSMPAAAGEPDSAEPLRGDEARRLRIYLEYREYAGANTTRTALPGIGARDSVDRLMGQVNESQVQAFLVLHDLTEKQLSAIITEGNNKNWASR